MRKALYDLTPPLQALTFPVKNLNSIPMSTLLSSLSVQQLRKAVTLKEKIQSLEKELGQLLGSSTNPAAHAVPKKKWKMSAAAKAKLSAKMKMIWARRKAKKSK